jgi:hypothetical protein
MPTATIFTTASSSERVCRLCGKTKPVSDFGRDRTDADGFNPVCRQCCRERQAKRPSHDVSVSEKTCRTCGKTKPAGEFWRRTALKDGLMSECKKCRGKRQVGFYAKWLKSDREKHPETKARWLLNNALNRGSITKPTRCEHCDKELPLHAHHGDYNRPLEVDWLCHSCHHKLHIKLNRAVA